MAIHSMTAIKDHLKLLTTVVSVLMDLIFSINSMADDHQLLDLNTTIMPYHNSLAKVLVCHLKTSSNKDRP